VVRVLL